MSDLQCSQGPFCQCPFLASFEKISGVQLPKLTQSLAPRNRQVGDGKFARLSTPTHLCPMAWFDLDLEMARTFGRRRPAALARGSKAKSGGLMQVDSGIIKMAPRLSPLRSRGESWTKDIQHRART
jgi:hypothetical protein